MADSGILRGLLGGQEIAASRQNMEINQEKLKAFIQEFQDYQADRAADQKAMADAAMYLPKMEAPPPSPIPPQPTSPGQASVPMMPPPPMGMRPPDTGMMPGASMPPPGAGGSAAQLMGAAAQGAPTGAPPAPAPPAGWKPSPVASPALGGPPAGAGAAASPPAPPVPAGGPPPSMPGAAPPAAPGGAPTPPVAKQGELPPQMMSLDTMRQAMLAKGMAPQDIYRALIKAEPIVAQQNKAVIAEMGVALRIATAQRQAADEALKYIREDRISKKEPAAVVTARKAAGEDPTVSPDAQKLLKDREVKAGTLSKSQRAGSIGGPPGSLGGYTGSYEKMGDAQKKTVDWYATMQIGGDSTWRVGLSRVKGGAELIKAVDERVPAMAEELGLSAADVGTNKAKGVASRAALTANTKDLATLEPYANMLDQNAEILKGLAKKAIATSAAIANKPLNWLRKNATDNPDVAEYLAQMEIVKNEATRVISNPRLVGQMTDTARQEIESIINGTMPLESTTRVLERLQNDSQRRVSTMKAQQSALQGTIKEMFPGGEKKEAPAADDLKGKVEAAGQKYEPDKYDYRIGPNGELQRKPKGS